MSPGKVSSDRWPARLLAWLDGPWALPGLFVFSLLESTVLPLALEAVLVPWMLARRDRVWRLAAVALAGCVAGALLGYGLGAWLFDSLGQWLLEQYGHVGAYERFSALFERQGFWAILAVGVLPIPFQVAMLTAGAADYPLSLFLLATLVARGLRYFGLAWLVGRFGERAMGLWRRRRGAVMAAALVVILLGWWLPRV